MNLDPFHLEEPSSYLLLATLAMYAGNILTRLFVLLIGANRSLVKMGDVNPALRKWANRIKWTFVYVPAAILFTYGIISSWRISHVSGVIIGIIVGLILFCGRLWFTWGDEKMTWMRDHYRWQRRNVLIAGNLILSLLVFSADWLLGYPHPGNLYVWFIIISLFDLLIFENSEVYLWKSVGVDIVGGIENPADIEAATEIVHGR